MKVLVADKIAASGIDYLRQQDGFEVKEAFTSSQQEIVELSRDVDAIIVRSRTKVTAEVIENAPRLKAVGRAGVGVDNIDIPAASERGIVVMNTPGGNTIATAELTFTQLLCSARPIAQANASMKEGRWDRKAYSGTELFNKTLGILGLGRIGSEVAQRARAFEMNVLAYDPYLTDERAKMLEVEKTDLEEVIRRSDFITVHMPLNDATRGLINKEAIAKMKDGVHLVNCARGGIIDEQDLLEALESGKVASAGLDVYTAEPPPEDSPLRKHPRLVTTPHLGASTVEAQESVGLEIAQAIVEVLKGGVIRNAVNMPSVDAKTLNILKPYLKLGYQAGKVLQQLAPPKVEKIKITYWGGIVDLDTMPLTRAIQSGYLSRISSSIVNDVNAPLVMKRLGINVDVVKSSSHSDYTELMRVEAIPADGGEVTSIEGTLIGKQQRPRLININGHEVESGFEGHLFVVENKDVLGIVGMLGMIMAKYDVNIANMSLSRNVVSNVAVTLLELDSLPPEEAVEEVRNDPNIVSVHLVEI